MPETARNNVLLLSIDALRSDCIGANKDKRRLLALGTKRAPVTPNLDEFLNSGFVFVDAFSAAPYTSASHASIFTGLLTSRHGIREHFRTPLHPHLKTLFSWYKANGYVTIMANDMSALFSKNLGLVRDVDHYVSTDDGAVAGLLRQHAGHPVFCFWHIADIHNPYGLTSLEVDGERFEEEVKRVERLAGNAYEAEGFQQINLQVLHDTDELELRHRYIQAVMSLYESGRYGELMDLYVEAIEHLDKNRLADILAVLRETGWRDGADIVLFGDHGEEYSDRCLMHQNGIVHGAFNVPVAFVSPRLPSGKVSDSVIRTMDIAPTLLALSNFEIDQPMDGISLMSHMIDKTPLDQVALGEMFHYSGETLDRQRDQWQACINDGTQIEQVDWVAPTMHKLYALDKRWRLTVERDLETGAESVSLYERESDLLETRNLADRHPRAMASLMRALRPLSDEFADFSHLPDEDALARISRELRNIGYLAPNEFGSRTDRSP